MLLLKVEYEFFDFEEPSSNAHELDRQLRLRFADSPTLYVSWTFERKHDAPGCQDYSIAYSQSSYFTDNAAHVIDASESPLWSRHIGREVELVYTPSASPKLDYQILELRSGTACTYVFSLGADKVGIWHESPLEGRFTFSI